MARCRRRGARRLLGAHGRLLELWLARPRREQLHAQRLINPPVFSPVQPPSKTKTAKNNCRMDWHRTLKTQPFFA